MKPIGPLMIEHRTIEKMVTLISIELKQIKVTGKADSLFITAAVDFFKNYADRTHHGKEEDILFKDLANKELSPDLQRIMNELVAEHVIARKTVRAVSDAIAAYSAGVSGVLETVIENLYTLTQLYPKHIEKEDKHFFYHVQEYFNEKEQADMLNAFWEFDRKMIHEKYLKVVQEMQGRLAKFPV